MSATTQCPTCNTRFKITQAQLEARRGMVRCGRCQAVFDARMYLQGDINPPGAQEAVLRESPAAMPAQAPEAAPPEPAIIPPAIEISTAEIAAGAEALPEDFIQTAFSEVAEAVPEAQPAVPEIHLPEVSLDMTAAPLAEAAPAPQEPFVPVAEDAPRAEPVFQAPPPPVVEIREDNSGSLAAEAVEPPAMPGIETPDMSLDMTQAPAAETAPQQALVPEAAHAELAHDAFGAWAAAGDVLPQAEPVATLEIPEAEMSLDMMLAAPQEAAHEFHGDDLASAWAAAEPAAPASEPVQAAQVLPFEAAAVNQDAPEAPDEMPAPEVNSDGTGGAPRERNKSTTLAQSVAFDVDPEEVHEEAPPEEKRKLPRPLLWGAASLLLLIAFAGEGAYFFRVELAAMQPDLKPALVSYCNLLRCAVPLPQKADLMDIESSELKADPERASVIALYALLHNRATYAQGYPVLELTLTDAQEKPLARRIFHPAEYLGAGEDETSGLAANRELNVKLNLDTTDLKPSGYRLLLYYPK